MWRKKPANLHSVRFLKVHIVKLGYTELLGTSKICWLKPVFVISGVITCTNHVFGTQQIFKFVHYNRECVTTEFVITKFDCECRVLQNIKNHIIGTCSFNVCNMFYNERVCHPYISRTLTSSHSILAKTIIILCHWKVSLSKQRVKNSHFIVTDLTITKTILRYFFPNIFQLIFCMSLTN